MLDEYDLGRMPRRRRGLPLILFLLSCFFTYAAGTYHWQPAIFGMQADQAHGVRWDLVGTWAQLKSNWQDGLIYMGCVMSVLLAHEMGHFLMTIRYRVPATYPIFIPMPLMMMGTMGAVIGMEGFRANRRQMFDIGLAGPLAGLAITVPLVWIGIKIGNHMMPQRGGFMFGDPLLAKWFDTLVAARHETGEELIMNPVYMAGLGWDVRDWFEHATDQPTGRRACEFILCFLAVAHHRSRIFVGGHCVIVLKGQVGWTLMVVIITFIGVDHPRTSDDTVPLGAVRTILGLLSLDYPFCVSRPTEFFRAKW